MLLMGPSASSGLAAQWVPCSGSSVSACQVCRYCTQLLQKHSQKEYLSHKVAQAELGTLFLISGRICDAYVPLSPNPVQIRTLGLIKHLLFRAPVFCDKVFGK